MKNPRFGYDRVLWYVGGSIVVAGLALMWVPLGLIVAGGWLMFEAVLLRAIQQQNKTERP